VIDYKNAARVASTARLPRPPARFSRLAALSPSAVAINGRSCRMVAVVMKKEPPPRAAPAPLPARAAVALNAVRRRLRPPSISALKLPNLPQRPPGSLVRSLLLL